jgi:hypothetical protein
LLQDRPDVLTLVIVYVFAYLYVCANAPTVPEVFVE